MWVKFWYKLTNRLSRKSDTFEFLSWINQSNQNLSKWNSPLFSLPSSLLPLAPSCQDHQNHWLPSKSNKPISHQTNAHTHTRKCYFASEKPKLKKCYGMNWGKQIDWCVVSRAQIENLKRNFGNSQRPIGWTTCSWSKPSIQCPRRILMGFTRRSTIHRPLHRWCWRFPPSCRPFASCPSCLNKLSTQRWFIKANK